MDVNDSVTQISALERFVVGNLDLEQFEEMLKKFDAFAFLGVSGSEETHSKILAWLLDPRGNHSAGDFFLTTLLRETGAATDEQIHNIDWSNTTVQREWYNVVAGIPQIKPTFLDIAPSGIPSNIIPHSKGVKCGLIRSNSPFSYSNHRPAKPKIPKPLVYAQVYPLGTSFATP